VRPLITGVFFLKKLSQLTILLALVLGYSNQAQAGLLIEPVVGYSFGNASIDLEVPSTPSANDSDKNSAKGTSYGGRLGYQNFGFQLGLDYLASNLKTDGDAFKTSEFAGFVGFEFPILLRVYAGYIFSGTGTLEGDDQDFKFKSGTGPKVGIGFTLLPFLDINLEYRSVKYEQLDETVSSLPVNIDLDYNAVMLAFSLPFVL
jgi:hypothetical protein